MAAGTMYTVEPSDTLPILATRFGVSRAAVVKANDMADDARVQVGQQLVIPGSGLSIPVDPYQPGRIGGLIKLAARQAGVDPYLAISVAWEESRLRQEARSGFGAIGVMQVEPGTARVVSEQLHERLDVEKLHDNVLVGVYWLRYLLNRYKGDESQALAAYYEGQANLTRHGYLRGAAKYVSDVTALQRSLRSIQTP